MNVHIEKGPTPGKRYGHSLVYYKPFFILFGGNLNNNFINIASGVVPNPRAAHAACCPNENQLIIYGGATGCKLKY